jgi:hypothetical protein
MWSAFVWGQSTDSMTLRLRLPVRGIYAVTDHLSNYYVITDKGSLDKYNAAGQWLGSYGTPRYGMPKYLDVSNPLRILVWYADAQTLVFLDRNMTEQGILNCLNADFLQVSTVAQASDGNIWLYDAALFRLYKIRPNGERLYESLPLNQYHFMDTDTPCLLELNERVWLYSNATGLLGFDLFLQLVTHLPDAATLPGSAQSLTVVHHAESCFLFSTPPPRFVFKSSEIEVYRP